MMSSSYYSRDLRGFIQTISPLTFFIRKAISDKNKLIPHEERQALLVLLDLIELKVGDKSYDLHDNDVSRMEKREQHRRVKDYVQVAGHAEQRRRKGMVDAGRHPRTESRLSEPMEQRFYAPSPPLDQ